MTASKSIRDPASGARLADALAAKQMTRSKLAREAGVSMKSIRRWLAGEPISRGNAYAVAKVLEVEAWAIWPDLGPTGALTDQRPSMMTPNRRCPSQIMASPMSSCPASRSSAHIRPPRSWPTPPTCGSWGLSLNQIVQSVSDRQLRTAVGRGTDLQCLFLEPKGCYISDRESEEGHIAGTLSQLTATNIDTLKRSRRHLPADTAHRLQLRTYNAPLRFNIIIIDELLAIVQFYLPAARGTESPSRSVPRPTATPPDLFSEFTTVFNDAWATAKEV